MAAFVVFTAMEVDCYQVQGSQLPPLPRCSHCKILATNGVLVLPDHCRKAVTNQVRSLLLALGYHYQRKNVVFFLDSLRGHYKLIDAVEGDQGNVKTVDGKEPNKERERGKSNRAPKLVECSEPAPPVPLIPLGTPGS